MLGLILAATLGADPCGPVAGAASELAGWPAGDLARHAARESLCSVIGPHPGDAGKAPTFARGACAPRWWVDAWPATEWAPRGPWGVAAAYAWCALPEPLRLLPPAALDHPIIGAAITARHHARIATVACASAPQHELARCVALARGNAASRRRWRSEYGGIE